MEQDAHAREAVSIADQTDNFEQHLSFQSSGKTLGNLLQSPGLIANCLPGEPQHLLFKGIKLLASQIREHVVNLGLGPALSSKSFRRLGLARLTAQTTGNDSKYERLNPP